MRPMKLSGEQIIFGKGALKHLETLKGKVAVLIVSKSFQKASGLLKKIETYLKVANIKAYVYDSAGSDPSFNTILEGRDFFLQKKPDVIVAIGGGSIIDAAKGMWVLYEHPHIETLSELAKCHNNMPKLRKRAYFVALPTTSGTASEVSRSMVISDPETHEKVGVSDMQLLADVAILDPELTVSLPKKLTAETGMDALMHGVESYLSTRSNVLSRTLSEKAIQLIIDSLGDSYQNGQNLNYREDLHLGSMLAGMAFSNVSLGIGHGISHSLGGIFGLSHGLLNGIMLPYIIKIAEKSDNGKNLVSELESKLNLVSLYDCVVALNKTIEIPKGLETLINRNSFFSRLDEVVSQSLADGCTKTSPYIPAHNELKDIFEIMYEGGEI